VDYSNIKRKHLTEFLFRLPIGSAATSGLSQSFFFRGSSLLLEKRRDKAIQLFTEGAKDLSMPDGEKCACNLAVLWLQSAENQ